MIRHSLYSLVGVIAAMATSTSAFVSRTHLSATVPYAANVALKMGAESEVAFGELDGSKIRVGIIRTRWNDEDVSNLIDGIKSGLTACKVPEDNIFIKEVPGAFELPFAAKLLAMSGTVDAIICTGVLIKGDTLHFEYIADAVSTGIMNVGLTTMTPCVFGVLTCLNEDQVKARSSGDSNHGVDWGKTAVEMALTRNEAMKRGGTTSEPGALSAVGFGTGDDSKPAEGEKKKTSGFF